MGHQFLKVFILRKLLFELNVRKILEVGVESRYLIDLLAVRRAVDLGLQLHWRKLPDISPIEGLEVLLAAKQGVVKVN